MLDTVPYYVKIYPHTVTPYSHNRYYLAAYNESQDLEGCHTKVLKAYAGVGQLPLGSSCRELKAAGMLFVSDLNDDCFANLLDFSLFTTQWLLDLDFPAEPNDLTAHVDGGSVVLEWAENVESDLDAYKVYRSEIHGGPYLLIADGVVINSHTDDTVVPGNTYYYVVTAIDTSGNESDYSNEASASP